MRVGFGLIALIIALDIAAPDSGDATTCKAWALSSSERCSRAGYLT
jgi:hypothetical protein